MDHAVIRTAAAHSTALIPGAATLYLAFSDGGYSPLPTGVLAALLLGLIALVAVVPRSPLLGWGRGVGSAAGALGGLALWAQLSGSWGISAMRATVEADRIVLYLAVLLLMASTGWSSARVRLMVGGLAAAIVLVAGVALASRLVPGTAPAADQAASTQLSHPVGYWNALGLLVGFGVVLCVHLAASLREPIWLRVLGAAGLPIVSSALLLTLSRGALGCTVLGVIVYVLVSRPRGLFAAAVAILPFTFLALLGLDHGAVVGSSAAQIHEFGLGSQPIWIIGFCAIAAGLTRLACAPIDRKLARVSLKAGLPRRVVISAACAVLLTAVLVGVVVEHTELGTRAFASFTATGGVGDGASRLNSLSNNNRLAKWRIALDEWRSEPLHGGGAGSFELAWDRARPTDGNYRDAHSLYVEQLGELGLVGFSLLLAAVAAIMLGLARRSRGSERAAPAGLLAIGVAWVTHAAVDLDWEMPVVTLWLFAAGGLLLARRADAAPRTSKRWVAAGLGVATASVFLALLLPVRLALSESALQRARTALAAGDCRTASESARSALDVMSNRWQAHYALGVCAASEGRWRAAQDAMREAVAGDEHNWLPLYGTAVVLAASGKDGSGELRLALSLNPRERLLRAAALTLQARNRAQRRRTARRARFPLPEL
jgi:hypothetical protein